MGFRHDMRGKSAQARAIVNARDEEDKRRKKEYEKKKEVEKLILDFLIEQTESKTPNEISSAITIDGREVLRALSDLVKQRKIDSEILEDKVSLVNSQHYYIKQKDRTDK